MAYVTRSRLPGVLIWWSGWLLAVGFAVWHSTAIGEYLDRVSETQFAEDAMTTPLRRVPQGIAADGQMWVRHALALAENSEWRLRSTDIDNAPEGRPVFWNSGWAQWLWFCGRVRMAFTGEPLAAAIETASIWVNLPVFLLVTAFASGWAWKRWGGAAGALLAVAMVGHRKFFEGFYAGYADHHGLINASILGLVLGALFTGGGWWKRRDGAEPMLLPGSRAEVMRAATVSAVCGAIGMWVSAASVVVMIALIGMAASMLATLRRREEGRGELECVPEAWSHWGRIGAGVSVAFYVFENFPDRLGLRLEVNHPLYSLAWWGGGELIAAVLSWRTHMRPVRWLARRLLGWGGAVLLAPAVVWIRGDQVFAPLNPFLARIHESIHEFEPIWVVISRVGWRPYGDQLLIMVLIVLLLLFWAARRKQALESVVVTFASMIALGATVLSGYQNRWMLTASAAQIVLISVLLLALTARFRRGVRLITLVGAATLFYAVGPWMLFSERRLVERVRDVQMGETMQLLYRDVAGALIKAGADGASVVLASPNTSVGVGYYGQLCTVGTLYWENGDGLQTAAEILLAGDDAEAAARIYAQGVTHVALISSYDFLDEYAYALSGDRTPVNAAEGFGSKLLYRHQVPTWLRPLHYAVPAPLERLNFKVALFAVDHESPASVAHERIGIYQLQKGERGLAEASLMASLTADASRPSPWFLQGQLMLADGRDEEAFNFLRAGIDRAPAADRDRLIEAVAGVFARRGEQGRLRAQSLLEMRRDVRPAE